MPCYINHNTEQETATKRKENKHELLRIFDERVGKYQAEIDRAEAEEEGFDDCDDSCCEPAPPDDYDGRYDYEPSVFDRI